MPRIDKFCINELQSVSILRIAEDLGLKVNRQKKCLCPFHADKSPSLKFWPKVNGWKCFGCGKKGTNIDLVMKLKNLQFHEACQWIADRNGIVLSYDEPLNPFNPSNSSNPSTPSTQSTPSTHSTSSTPSTPISTLTNPMHTLPHNLIAQYLGSHSAFGRSLLATGILTEPQLQHAVETYRLGCTKDDGVIFWQIDLDNQLRDGKVMFYLDDCHRDHSRNPSWVSFRLMKRGVLSADWRASPCLFGLHLVGLRNDVPALPGQAVAPIVAVVESEKTAVICSELIPTHEGRPILWMASGGLSALSVDLLRPLTGHDVILFPDTDVTGQTFKLWSEVAQAASDQLKHPFYVSPMLEQCASADQKGRKIDIADLLVLGQR